ncbi:MAG: hypothetical protein GXO34_04325 [Deltaproteobacteria bacterium]|nr:hypothetical protein [Deltaproteobacteria bacterium]
MRSRASCYRHKVLPALLLFFLFLPGGCGSRPEPITKTLTTGPPARICRVAILPFTCNNGDPRLGLKAERIFFSELVQAHLFQVLPEGDIELFFYRNRILPETAPGTDELRAMREQLGIDAVITGRINTIEHSHIGPGYLISLELDLVDTVNGEKIAATFLRRRGTDYQKVLHFGLITTVSGLLQQMARDIFQQWRLQGYGGC